MFVRLLLPLIVIALAGSRPAVAQVGYEVLWIENFESGLGNWTPTGEWGVDFEATKCAKRAAPFPSSVSAARCGSPKVPWQPCDYQEGSSFLTLDTPVVLPATATAATLDVDSFSDVECETCGYDDRFILVYANGLPVTSAQLEGPLQAWTTESLDLTPWIGQSIVLVFYFETYDETNNDGIGWLIDDVRITVNIDPSCSPEVHVVNYCTAGTSASGCQALLSNTGAPSLSSPSGFVVNASTVEGSRPGILYYGFNGAQAVQWGNGTSYRCVVPPILRGPLMQTSRGTPGSCEGSFSLDVNAYWTSAPAHKVPVAGQDVYLQFWYRDNASTSNKGTSFSDGLWFVACP